MANLNKIKKIALAAAKREVPSEFSAEYNLDTVDAALAGEIGAMCTSINEFQRNKYDIFEIITTVVDEVVPRKVTDRVSMFAEVRTVPQGQRAVFRKKGLGRNRAKQFITQVGLSGIYETFRLDSETFTVGAHAIGGGARLDFERFLDGAETISEYMEIVTEGLEEATYYEIVKALQAAYNVANRPAVNKYESNTFDSAEMQKLISIVKAYHDSAIIFACPEFVEAMGPDVLVPGTAGYQAIYSPRDLEDIANYSRVRVFRGTPIVEIPQNFIDTANEKTAINPQYAYILPAGGEKVVKIVFEGNTQVYDWVNPDNSIEIMTYKKIGSAIMTHHDWCIYKNNGLEDTSASFYGFANDYDN